MPPSKKRTSSIVKNGRRQFSIALREPRVLPNDEIELPSPDNLPPEPPSPKLLTMILPPIIMVGGMVVYTLASRTTNLTLIIPMLLMSLGFPAANLISQASEKKKFQQKLEQREEEYLNKLAEVKKLIRQLIQRQRSVLDQEYPRLREVLEICISLGSNPRLWWRRPHDDDFLCLRMGTGNLRTSFTIKSPRVFDPKDPLLKHAQQLIHEYEWSPAMPLMLDLKTAGSLILAGSSVKAVEPLMRRLVLDLIVHHSPYDVEIFILADRHGSEEKWAWLKWAPHTKALTGRATTRHLSFTLKQNGLILSELMDLFEIRRQQSKNFSDHQNIQTPAIVVLLEDAGLTRQSPDLALIAAQGFNYGIYLIFMGEQNAPNSCRTRIDIHENGGFRYLETWSGKGDGLSIEGQAEFAQILELEKACRTLAGLEIAGGKNAIELPDTVRISQILGSKSLSLNDIVKNWSTPRPETEQVLFPIGLTVGREGLCPLCVDFRPEEIGGASEYHAMLIGTTGSGKSIFLQSLVLATAFKYSPNLINFLFMDFKAGAAELKKISGLPHVIGMINDLTPALAERALQALENELDRRKLEFDSAGKITDIWDYNRRFSGQMMPHLLVVIDEFSEGIKILPNLVDRLRELGRQGRAFGMYFLLANQEVNAAAESLKSNVGWYVVLKVKRPEEMALIDRSLPIASSRGRGYLRMKSDIFEFQGAYAGLPILQDAIASREEFEISEALADGTLKQVFSQSPYDSEIDGKQSTLKSEMDTILDLCKDAFNQLSLKPHQPIYTEPLRVDKTLSELLEKVSTFRSFERNVWSDILNPTHWLKVPIGEIDLPQVCDQQPLVLDFGLGDGHLWIIGSPGSGKDRVIKSTLLSLSTTHTPEEVQFYIVDLGSGKMKDLDLLPHTGAVIRQAEKERLERLGRYLEIQLEERSIRYEPHHYDFPEIIVVVYNYYEVKNLPPELADLFTRIVSIGKGIGIHMIIATNRGNDINRVVSSNIAQRIVLQMATSEEYQDVIGVRPFSLSMKAESRGYWVGNTVAECQVALPVLDNQQLISYSNQAAIINSAWCGRKRPIPIETIPEVIEYSQIQKDLKVDANDQSKWMIPLGYAYDTIEMIWADWLAEMPIWLILGPRLTGKTSFLIWLCMAIYQQSTSETIISIFAPRRGPLSRIEPSALPGKILSTSEQMMEVLEQIQSKLNDQDHPKFVLLIDDAGSLFNPEFSQVFALLNQICTQFSSIHDLFMVVSGSRDELQTQSLSPFVKLLRQSRTGLSLSYEITDLDWLGIQGTLQLRRVGLIQGRGVWSSLGRSRHIQFPLVRLTRQ